MMKPSLLISIRLRDTLLHMMICPREEYAQEMLSFSNNSSGGNPTSTSEPIISDSSPPSLRIEFPLAVEVPTASEEGCHCQKKRDATARKIALLSKSRRNCQSKSNDNFTKVIITLEDPISKVSTSGKFEQWQFWIQQYLQHEHYALWEVIEFGDSYEVPTSNASTTTTDTPSGETGKMLGRIVTLTTEDMQKKKNDVKARTTLLLSLPDENQLQFKLWAAILKTFGGNETTKKTKKNLLKQQYENFKAKGSENLEQTFNRLQVIVGQFQFMDVEIEQDNLN
nr:hypothetical protein [Tanacetum cinerariifolium]